MLYDFELNMSTFPITGIQEFSGEGRGLFYENIYCIYIVYIFYVLFKIKDIFEFLYYI